MGRVYLIAHAPTIWDTGPSPKQTGWKPLPLSRYGQQSAEALAKTLSRKGIGRIASSDLPRTAGTAMAIGEATGIKPELYKELRGPDIGTMAGKTESSTKQTYNMHVRNPDVAFPGGESIRTWVDRLGPKVNELLEDAKTSPTAMAIISHGKSLNYIKAGITGNPKHLTGDSVGHAKYETIIHNGQGWEYL